MWGILPAFFFLLPGLLLGQRFHQGFHGLLQQVSAEGLVHLGNGVSWWVGGGETAGQGPVLTAERLGVEKSPTVRASEWESILFLPDPPPSALSNSQKVEMQWFWASCAQ